MAGGADVPEDRARPGRGAGAVIAATLKRHGMDGVIATNTTIARDAVQGLPHADEAGGLSGAAGVRGQQPRHPRSCARRWARGSRSSAWAA
jgi:hypothetical protein